MKKYNVAVIGATGNVGRQTLEILAERNFPVNKIHAVASSNSIGKEISFGDDILKISNLDNLDFSEVDIAFFCAGSAVSEKYVPKAVDKGTVVIDKSSFFRLKPDVPLIVPEANLQVLEQYILDNKLPNKGYIIANPNCCAIPIAVALKPLDNAAKIKRIVASTYQSTSGAGTIGMDELYSQTKAKYVFEQQEPVAFPRQIAFNVFPHIGEFNEDGSTSEERKIELELAKIIGSHALSTVTSVRVPVFVGHCISVNVEFENAIDAKEAMEILLEADGVNILSCDNDNKYSTPIDVVGEDVVYVSRIRDDKSTKNAINLWIAVDNLRKGAALNGVQIAESVIS